MREQKRIKRIIERLTILWELQPDMRLGQLLENYVFGHHSQSNGCIFYIEDTDIEKNIDIAIKTVRRNKDGGRN